MSGSKKVGDPMRISYNFLPVVSGPTLVAAYWHTSVPSSTFPLLTDFQQIHLGFPKQWFNQKERLSGWRQFNLLMLIKFITCIIAFSLEKYWLSQEKIDVDHFWDLKGLIMTYYNQNISIQETSRLFTINHILAKLLIHSLGKCQQNYVTFTEKQTYQ